MLKSSLVGRRFRIGAVLAATLFALYLVSSNQLLSIPQDLELPPPPPDTSVADNTTDINQLKAQVNLLQMQVNQLQTTVNQLAIAAQDEKAVMMVVASANSFEEARRLVREKLGLAETDSSGRVTDLDGYLRNYRANRNRLQDRLKALKLQHDRLRPKIVPLR